MGAGDEKGTRRILMMLPMEGIVEEKTGMDLAGGLRLRVDPEIGWTEMLD